MAEHENMQQSTHAIASSLHYQPEVYAARFGEYSNLDTADVSNLTAIVLPQQSNAIPSDDQTHSSLSFTRLLTHGSAQSVSDYPCRKEGATEFSVPKEQPVVDSTFSCEHCAFVTKSKASLKRHAKVHNVVAPTRSVEARPFACQQCGKRYKKKYTLKEHENTHLQDHEKPFACGECSRRFATGGVLARHVRYRHSSQAEADKLHRCDQCSYASVEKAKLRRHIRTHTLERPFRCEYCLYAARDEFKLKRHTRTHTLEKPYECPVCHVRFAQRNTMKRHTEVHRDDRETTRLNCESCTATFYRMQDLDKHRQVQHGINEPPLGCSKCLERFSDRHSLKIHIRDQHPIAKRPVPVRATKRNKSIRDSSGSVIDGLKSSSVDFEHVHSEEAQPILTNTVSPEDTREDEREATSTGSELREQRSDTLLSRTFRSEDESAEMFEAASVMLSMAKETSQVNETDSETRSQSPCTLR